MCIRACLIYLSLYYNFVDNFKMRALKIEIFNALKYVIDLQIVFAYR